MDEGVASIRIIEAIGKSIAADLLGVANVRIYHDHALYQRSWWAGYVLAPGYNTTGRWIRRILVTMAMPLTDQNIENGGLFVFATGSHRHGTIMDSKLSSEPDGTYRKYIREHQFPLSRAAGMRAGDANPGIMGIRCIHTSANLSEKRREMVTITYMADGARVAQPVHPGPGEYELKYVAE